MSVTDTGFLVALANEREPDHRRCLDAMHSLRSQMITSWAVLTEAMHILGRDLGWRGQERLWQMITRRAVDLREVTPPMLERSHELMTTYRDLPMDLADATLVALAEAEQDWQVLTLDEHFRLYRPRGRASFDILPRGQ